jgi:hypothetical protein
MFSRGRGCGVAEVATASEFRCCNVRGLPQDTCSLPSGRHRLFSLVVRPFNLPNCFSLCPCIPASLHPSVRFPCRRYGAASAGQKQIRSGRVRMRRNEGCAPARSLQAAVAAVATRPPPPSTAAIQARDLRREQYPATTAAAAAAATTGLAKVGQAQIRSRRAPPYSCCVCAPRRVAAARASSLAPSLSPTLIASVPPCCPPRQTARPGLGVRHAVHGMPPSASIYTIISHVISPTLAPPPFSASVSLLPTMSLV